MVGRSHRQVGQSHATQPRMEHQSRMTETAIRCIGDAVAVDGARHLEEQVGGGDEDCLYLAVHVPLREDGGTGYTMVMISVETR